MLGAPELDAGLQVGSDESRVLKQPILPALVLEVAGLIRRGVNVLLCDGLRSYRSPLHSPKGQARFWSCSADRSLGKAELKSPDDREVLWDADKRLLTNPSYSLSFFKGVRVMKNDSN